MFSLLLGERYREEKESHGGAEYRKSSNQNDYSKRTKEKLSEQKHYFDAFEFLSYLSCNMLRNPRKKPFERGYGALEPKEI